MNIRAATKVRDNALDALTPAQQAEARAAWHRAWEYRREGVLRRDVNRARLAMLSALAAGQSIHEAEQIARLELARTNNHEGNVTMTNAQRIAHYRYSRPFRLSHLKQVRMMVRDGRYVAEGRSLIRQAQREAARIRRNLYA